ncbi:MAG: ribbon-helix-helix protein, CopG family [bacterium]|nr:ribbon-helix-helix protein, CopG family [bacterium]
MTTSTFTRTTITLPESVYRALKVRAAETNRSVSGLVEEAVKYQILEDLEDTEAVRARAKEPSLSFDSFTAKLKADGLL